MKNKQIVAGDTFKTNEGGRVRVLKFNGCYDVIVEHDDAHRHTCKVTANQLRSGRMKNPYMPRIHGVGFIGAGSHRPSLNGRDTRQYTMWTRMLERCYCPKKQKSNPAYIGCIVHESWHNFQAFADWYEDQPYKGDGYQLDKDIIKKGNKMYCPEFCRIVPAQINKLLGDNRARRGDLPMGMQEKNGRFYVKLSKFGSMVYIGAYGDVKEAFNAYKEAREAYIKECAEYFRSAMDDDVYEALLGISISIDD